MKRLRVIRIVVPARDYKKVEDLIKKLKKRAISQEYIVLKLFETRPDLDSIEYTFIVELTSSEEKELAKLLSMKLSGSIGFFIIRKYKENNTNLR